MSLWQTLEVSWRTCLNLAWESYLRGSLPIAAVILDDAGSIVARGRNRLQEDAVNTPHFLHRHPLAHAEVNALLDFLFGNLEPERCTLLTTTEPCPLCVGALRMSHIGALVYAARDPWAGATRLFETDACIARKGMRVASLAGSPLEMCLVALQSEAHLRGVRAGSAPSTLAFFEVWREVLPRGVAAGERLFRAGTLRELARSGADAAEVLAQLERAVAGANG